MVKNVTYAKFREVLESLGYVPEAAGRDTHLPQSQPPFESSFRSCRDDDNRCRLVRDADLVSVRTSLWKRRGQIGMITHSIRSS